MGFGVSKEKIKKEKPPVTAERLKTLLSAAKARCTQQKNKSVGLIQKKEQEIIKSLQLNRLEDAKAKMNNLLADEDRIKVYENLNTIFEILKEKCTRIISNDECPADIRAQLDTVLYASIRLEIEELKQFHDLIIQKYGEAYVTKAKNNEDKLVNKNIEERLRSTVFSEVMVKQRLKQLCIKKNINFKFDEDIPPGPEILDVEMDKNPYESMRPNLPTQSFVQEMLT